MYSRVETITPEIAKQYLLNNTKNRPLKHGAIRNYATDMRNGKWQLSPQGISFYKNGQLADGQNRLEAVIQADVPVLFYVTYDVPNESTIQDRGVSRSTRDVLRMNGMDSGAASYLGVGIANALFLLAGNHDVSESTRIAFIQENEELLDASTKLVVRGVSGTPVCKKAIIGAAAFCALYAGLAFEDLEKFFIVANTGFQNSVHESAAVVLRNHLFTDYTNKAHANKRESFSVATNAIRDFCVGTPRTRRYKASREPAFFGYVKRLAIDKYLI